MEELRVVRLPEVLVQEERLVHLVRVLLEALHMLED
jgi:hypothetical protein